MIKVHCTKCDRRMVDHEGNIYVCLGCESKVKVDEMS